MFSFDELRVIQIEITNRCQASCPMCARNIHGGIENPLVKTADWSLDDFKFIFNADVLSILTHINFCGDYGEPTINSNIIEMVRYAASVNPKITISINTNGSTRTESWWAELARALPKEHKVYFGLDGLEDTHSLYRIGTNFNKIIDNAKAFISAGGTATWHFIAFQHNEHQIDEARLFSKKIGFHEFVVKHSRRFGKEFPVLDKEGNRIYYINPPSNTKVKHISIVDISDLTKFKDAKVNCDSNNFKEVFIDAQFKLTPCCMTGYLHQANFDYELYKKYNLEEYAERFDLHNQYRDFFFQYIDSIGGWEALNVRKHGLKEILNRENWQTVLKQEWENKSNKAGFCLLICSDKSPYIRIEEQEISRA